MDDWATWCQPLPKHTSLLIQTTQTRLQFLPKWFILPWMWVTLVIIRCSRGRIWCLLLVAICRLGTLSHSWSISPSGVLHVQQMWQDVQRYEWTWAPSGLTLPLHSCHSRRDILCINNYACGTSRHPYLFTLYTFAIANFNDWYSLCSYALQHL